MSPRGSCVSEECHHHVSHGEKQASSTAFSASEVRENSRNSHSFGEKKNRRSNSVINHFRVDFPFFVSFNARRDQVQTLHRHREGNSCGETTNANERM